MHTPYKRLFLTVIGVSLVSMVIGFWIFEGSGFFIPVVAASGIAMAVAVKEPRLFRYLLMMVIGSVSYSISVIVLGNLRNVFFSHLLGDGDFPFPMPGWTDSLSVYIFIGVAIFISALVAIAVKGTCELMMDKH